MPQLIFNTGQSSICVFSMHRGCSRLHTELWSIPLVCTHQAANGGIFQTAFACWLSQSLFTNLDVTFRQDNASATSFYPLVRREICGGEYDRRNYFRAEGDADAVGHRLQGAAHPTRQGLPLQNTVQIVICRAEKTKKGPQRQGRL